MNTQFKIGQTPLPSSIMKLENGLKPRVSINVQPPLVTPSLPKMPDLPVLPKELPIINPPMKVDIDFMEFQKGVNKEKQVRIVMIVGLAITIITGVIVVNYMCKQLTKINNDEQD